MISGTTARPTAPLALSNHGTYPTCGIDAARQLLGGE
jgi:hypothetical protein